MKSALSLSVWVSASLMLLATLLLATGPARAYEPEMDYWFVEHFSVGQVDLSEGVSVSTSDPTTEPRGRLLVKNQTEKPLYIMSLNYKDVLVMPTPDAAWKTRVTLAHEAAAYLVLPERPAALTMEALVDLDPSLVDHNILASSPPPKDLVVPTEQSSELLIVYDQRVIEVPFSLSYTINPSYGNGAGTSQASPTDVQATGLANSTPTATNPTLTARLGEKTVVLGLAAAAVLLVGGWVTWKVTHRGS